ncbi:MAG TPA: LytTR family transcriptional regulator DNA-binding domain-containing protein [Salinivirga sp.]|uniref:LytR/AlgR family response regulator transcription factor n=1 Tax=Salinivirga sp. TaxID=1970192 RepID=UPI002B46E86A|nr:LytTR family transcriptional regulator DNA-binding domain-containing protein [Salinivirga sp.]HKK59525.1 LytTR family transcriptional regulator DNA-binding domain-containing protein [Salinivirga sp.]
MIKTIIIEDELPARNVLKHYLSRHEEFSLVAECTNGFEGVKAINEHRPELILLDIQMPKLNGFEMLELVDPMPAVIFTTAYDEYAIRAFETNAVDYLLKPFDENRFDTAIDKAMKRINDDISPEINKAAESTVSQPLDQVVVSSGNKIEILPPEDIYMIEAQDDYVMIHTNTEQYLKKKTMLFYEKHLGDHFLRIHRSYIINTKQIGNIELYGKQQYQIRLKNNMTVKTSKSGYKKIKEKLML